MIYHEMWRSIVISESFDHHTHTSSDIRPGTQLLNGSPSSETDGMPQIEHRFPTNYRNLRSIMLTVLQNETTAFGRLTLILYKRVSPIGYQFSIWANLKNCISKVQNRSAQLCFETKALSFSRRGKIGDGMASKNLGAFGEEKDLFCWQVESSISVL